MRMSMSMSTSGSAMPTPTMSWAMGAGSGSMASMTASPTSSTPVFTGAADSMTVSVGGVFGALVAVAGFFL
ncbi:hypothetical protein BDW74DRAFT_160551 [Aspergillus multicolor]|uniref:uncharacterized protein n=1 Tax=Aspergillus multicolor TaxID=41759 RepID=UPI003CCD6141